MCLRSGLLTVLLALTACQSDAVSADTAPARQAVDAAPVNSSTPTAVPGARQAEIAAGETSQSDNRALQSCEAQIGAAAAIALATQCRAVSPATRPPCNAANSCALIRDETARGCAMLGTAAAKKAGCVDPEGAEAAVAVVERYYEAIAAHDTGTAFALWGGETADGKSRAEFARGFADTRSVTVAPGKPGRIEGAAGSRYVTVPVTVESTLRGGTRQRFTGEYHLRRVAPIDGAAADERRWHIDTATLIRR